MIQKQIVKKIISLQPPGPEISSHMRESTQYPQHRLPGLKLPILTTTTVDNHRSPTSPCLRLSPTTRANFSGGQPVFINLNQSGDNVLPHIQPRTEAQRIAGGPPPLRTSERKSIHTNAHKVQPRLVNLHNSGKTAETPQQKYTRQQTQKLRNFVQDFNQNKFNNWLLCPYGFDPKNADPKTFILQQFEYGMETAQSAYNRGDYALSIIMTLKLMRLAAVERSKITPPTAAQMLGSTPPLDRRVGFTHHIKKLERNVRILLGNQALALTETKVGRSILKLMKTINPPLTTLRQLP